MQGKGFESSNVRRHYYSDTQEVKGYVLGEWPWSRRSSASVRFVDANYLQAAC